jgi:hypothetical protein
MKRLILRTAPISPTAIVGLGMDSFDGGYTSVILIS